jgi:hypothetical protein
MKKLTNAALFSRVVKLEEAFRRERALRRVGHWLLARSLDPTTSLTNITTECEVVLGLSHNSSPDLVYKIFVVMQAFAQAIPDSSANTMAKLNDWIYQ